MTVSAHASARTILRLSTALCRYLAVPGVHSWEPEGPRLSLSGLRAYQWDYLYHRLGGGGVQNGTTDPISEDFQRPFHSQISYKCGSPCRLTCQGHNENLC